ncbi:hypothetical protein ACNFJ7_10890 [Sphingomonas sp. HT-1]|uniref:hypothetical protein n=1 Tax=unclassified Sphingomonas TaxID=196159 RepID=UPI000368904F|nr:MULTISPECIES: hypothetical protein [unclassified Sphingomonas]KTF70336.1 hypothetical protein ATB93_04775 [Sphingomonas sp. WG]
MLAQDARAGQGCPQAHRRRSRVIANGLRELDRFLNILIDEACWRHGFAAQPRQRNTANKLAAFHAQRGQRQNERPRLEALARARDALFHCNGMALRGDRRGGAVLTLGWPAAADAASLATIAVGAAIVVTGGDMASVCGYYRRLADALLEG